MSFVEKLGITLTFEMEGYSEGEIKKIEMLYDIKVEGDFKDFLIEIGRSFGTVLGDDLMVQYSPSMSVRNQIFYQFRIVEDLRDCGCKKVIARKPFSFAVLYETQYYFIFTASDEPDRVYHYDENERTVKKTEYTFLEFFKILLEFKKKHPPRNNAVCKGELLLINA